MHVVSKKMLNEQNVFIIQPYIKWGPKKSTIRPELLLEEAESLIRTLPNWNIECSIKVGLIKILFYTYRKFLLRFMISFSCIKVPVENLDRKVIIGSGKLEEIKEMIANVISRGKVVS